MNIQTFRPGVPGQPAAPAVRIVSAVLALSTVAFAGTASAEATAVAYPDRPVRLVVGWAPGGVADVAARLLAERLGKKWQQSVVVDNKAGASGAIATAAVADAPANGYTLQLVTAPEVTINPFLSKLTYRLDRDFIPITLTTLNPMVLAVNANAPYRNAAELIAAAKANPRAIAYSTAGKGSSPHLFAEMVAREAGITLLHVPYKGGAPASVAVVGGEVPLGALAASAAVPFVQSGKLHVIGITGRQRFPGLPDWPTLAEQGLQSAADASVWTGVFAKAGTPADIVRKIDRDIREVLAEPDVAQKLATLGGVPGTLSLGDFSAFIAAEMERNKAVVQAAILDPN